MKAICLARELRVKQREDAGANPIVDPEYQITPGKEYLILGLQFVVRSNIYGSTSLFEIEDDAGRCISTPSPLFQITDPRPSKWWVVRQNERNWLKLWPEEFYADYFHDDLSEGKTISVESFRQVKSRLEVEAAEQDAKGF